MVALLAITMGGGPLDRIANPLGLSSFISQAAAKDGGRGGGEGGSGHGSGGGGSGGSGSGHGGDDHGGGDDGGGDDGGDSSKGGGRGKDADDRRTVQRFMDRLQRSGTVAWSEKKGDSVSVRYSDGWSERVAGGVYRLADDRNRVVVERRAKSSDVKRLAAAAQGR